MTEKVKKFVSDHSVEIAAGVAAGACCALSYCIGHRMSYKQCLRYKQQFLSWLLEHPEGFKLKNTEIPGEFLLKLTKVA